MASIVVKSRATGDGDWMGLVVGGADVGRGDPEVPGADGEGGGVGVGPVAHAATRMARSRAGRWRMAIWTSDRPSCDVDPCPERSATNGVSGAVAHPTLWRMDGRRMLVWDKEAGYGVESAEVTLNVDHLTASTLAIGWDPLPYRLEYELTTVRGWATEGLIARTAGDGWRRRLDLRRSDDGTWTIDAEAEGDVDLPPPGGSVEAIRNAIDCDVAGSPLTNTMPVLRHGLLHEPGALTFTMAFVDVPSLAVGRSRQRYEVVGDDADGGRRIEYRSLDSDFRSELTFDPDGLVISYPRLGRRVGGDR
jgi:uncharacterized protein